MGGCEVEWPGDLCAAGIVPLAKDCGAGMKDGEFDEVAAILERWSAMLERWDDGDLKELKMIDLTEWEQRLLYEAASAGYCWLKTR